MSGTPDHRPLALITGAAHGIGAEVARQLAEAGHAVIVSARDAAAAERQASALRAAGHHAIATALDITNQSSIDNLVSTLAHRPLAVLVNNAAQFADWSETATTADLANARNVMDTNLFGAWNLTQAVLPSLRRAGHARIVNVGSGAGSHGDSQFGLASNPASVSYAVSKAALHALTVKLATELQPEGILVNAVDPGLTATAPGMEAMGARPISDGARSVTWAALLDDNGPTGTFTRDGQPFPW